MKKIVPIAILLLLIVFVGGPYYSGKVAETETKKIIEQLNHSSSEYGATEVLSYERGVRSTHAKYRYTPPPAFAMLFDNTQNIDFSCNSSHGITGIDYDCKLDGESAYSDFVKEKLNGNDPVSLYGSVSAFGGITQNISLDAITDLEIDGEKITLPTANIAVSTDSNMQQFDVSGGSEAFSVTSDNGSLSIGKMTLDGDLTRLEEQLFTGDFKMELEQLSMQSPEGNSSFKAISMTTKAEEKGENLNSSARISVAEMTIPNGLVNSVEDLVFSFVANGLDTQAMIEYQALMSDMQRDILLAVENNQEPPESTMQMAAALPIIERMMKAGLELNAKLDATLDGEANGAELDIKLLDKLTMAQLPSFMSQPDVALKKVKIGVTAALDKKLIDAQPMVAGMVSQSPLVKASTDQYSLNLALGEKIELNGKAMTFQELQMLVLSSMPTQ